MIYLKNDPKISEKIDPIGIFLFSQQNFYNHDNFFRKILR